MSERTIPIIWIIDNDGYAILGVDGFIEIDPTDNMRAEDALHYVAQINNDNLGAKIEIKTFSLSQCQTYELPALKTINDIQHWHVEKFGKEMQSGW